MISNDVKILIEHVNYMCIDRLPEKSMELSETIDIQKNVVKIKFMCKELPEQQLIAQATLSATEDYFYENKDALIAELNYGFYNQILQSVVMTPQSLELNKLYLN